MSTFAPQTCAYNGLDNGYRMLVCASVMPVERDQHGAWSCLPSAACFAHVCQWLPMALPSCLIALACTHKSFSAQRSV